MLLIKEGILIIKFRKSVVSSIIFSSAFLFTSNVQADCLKTDGLVDYDKIPNIISDAKGDASGGTIYYWDTNSSSWSTSNTGSGYTYNTGRNGDIKKLGLCIDNAERGTGISMFMRLQMEGFPGCYKDGSNNKLYQTGAGPLGEDVGNPTDERLSMVFAFADSKKLKRDKTADVWYLVAGFNRLEGDKSFEDSEGDSGPSVFWLYKDNTPITKENQFDVRNFSESTATFVADLMDGEDEGGDPGEGSPGEGEGGGGGSSDPDPDAAFSSEMLVEAPLTAFTLISGIGANSEILVRVYTTREVPNFERDSGSVNSLVSAIIDASKKAKGKLSRLKKVK